MNKLLSAVLLSLTVFTASAQTQLKVFLTDGSQLSLEVDYKHFQKMGTSITVGDLPAGRHDIRIFQPHETVFRKVVQDVIYVGKVKTYEGRITIFELDPETGGINVYDEDADSFRLNPSIKSDTSYSGSTLQPANSVAPAGTIAAAKLTALKAKVDDIVADTRKMTAIKEGLAGEHLSALQVGTIMQWLGFEASREEFAEWAFPLTVDKANYPTLLDQFSYKENQDALAEFLKKQ